VLLFRIDVRLVTQTDDRKEQGSEEVLEADIQPFLEILDRPQPDVIAPQLIVLLKSEACQETHDCVEKLVYEEGNYEDDVDEQEDGALEVDHADGLAVAVALVGSDGFVEKFDDGLADIFDDTDRVDDEVVAA